MAIGSTKGAGIRSEGAAIVVAGSSKSTIVTANDDARTAQTTAMLYNPSSITDSTFHWVRIPVGTTRAALRAKVPKATSAVATSPIVYILGAFATIDSITDCAGVADGTVQFFRLDAATWGGTGSTLTFQGSPSTSVSPNDTTYFYSEVLSLSATDLQGAGWVGVAVKTAGACTASAAMPIDMILLN